MNTEIRRGEEAAQLLANPLVEEAFAKLEELAMTHIRQANLADNADLAGRFALVQTIDRFRRYFTEVVNTGKLAKAQEELTASAPKREALRRRA